MAGYQLMRGINIAFFFPCFGQHIFLFWLKHGKRPDLFKIARQITVGAKNRHG
jgi:hypothetical protein